jgi:hypothetical protein
MENAEKFEKWIKAPLDALREVPEGSGAFVAVLTVMAVLNGLAKAVYYKEIDDPKSPDATLPTDEMIADFLGLDAGDVSGWRHAMAAESWQMFKVPKKSLIIGCDYGAVPTLGESGKWEVDPWKFADLVLGKAAENQDLIDGGYFPLMRAYVEDDSDDG